MRTFLKALISRIGNLYVAFVSKHNQHVSLVRYLRNLKLRTEKLLNKAALMRRKGKKRENRNEKVDCEDAVIPIS